MEKKTKKIRFDRKYCQSCDKPSEYRYDGLTTLYLKCWSCGEAIQVYAGNLGKEAVWKEQAEYVAEKQAQYQAEQAKKKDKETRV